MVDLNQLLSLPLDGQLSVLKDDPDARAIAAAWLGPRAFRELIAYQPDAGHLSSKPRNLIFAPGVMGSMLRSQLGGIWWIDMPRARDQLDRLALNLEGTSDAESEASIEACAIDLSYVPFMQAVAQTEDLGAVPFEYDWRRLLTTSTHRFRDLVKACHAEHRKPIHLVGHSMGGLLIRTALMEHADELWPLIGKVVFIGTPHYGSPSIAGYLKNHLWGWEAIAVLGLFLSRATFRSLWGVLSLLPAPRGVYPGTRQGVDHPCANFDLYDATAWRLELDAAATTQLQRVLDGVAHYHRSLFSWHAGLLQEHKDRMLVIAGVGYETLFRLEYSQAFWGVWEHVKKITARQAGHVDREGDGRVPLASAELEDVQRRYVRGIHGGLPNIPAVARDVFAWLRDKPLSLPATPQGALGGHLAADNTISEAPVLDGSAVADPFSEKFDRYRDIPPDELKRLRAKLEAGELEEMNLVRLL